jgi:hypothetical protein
VPYKDRDKYLKSQKSYYWKDPRYKWRNVENKFGLTKSDFLDLLDKQDNKCALCNKSFEGLSRRFIHIDHCYETNRIRGLP